MDSVLSWFGSGKSKESGGASALWTEKSYLKFKLILSGKTLNSHEDFITRLKQRVHLKEVNTEDECDFILVFCPIVTRPGTDIEAAMKILHNFSNTKPVVLVVLHHTFDPECDVPDSIKYVNRKNMIAVDCLFHEDKGLLQCLKNNESLDKTSQYLEKELHIKLKKQEQELRKRTRVNEEKDEGLNDTIVSNETQEGTNTPHERNQQLNKIEIVEEIVKRNEMKKKIAKEYEEDFEYLMEMIIISEKQKTDFQEKNRDLLGQLEEKERQQENVVKELEIKLTERDEQLQEKDRLLTENTQTLQKKDKTLEEKEKQLSEVREELRKSNMTLEKNQTQLKDKETQLESVVKKLETSTNKLDTLGQELQDKQRQLQDMMIVVEQQKSELAEKKQQLKEKDRLLAKTRQKLEMKDETLEQKGTHVFQLKKKVKCYEVIPPKVQAPCDQFTKELKKIRNSMETSTEEECKAILYYVPIVSRAGTDIEAALQKLNSFGDKYIAIVMLHQTSDRELITPDSSRTVTREKTFIVDCLFSEDEGLFLCRKNDEAIRKVAEWLKFVKHDKQEPKKKASEENEASEASEASVRKPVRKIKK